MFKVLSQKSLVKEIERAGFTLVRQGSHKIFQRGNETIIIPHSKTISAGIVHGVFKALKKAA